MVQGQAYIDRLTATSSEAASAAASPELDRLMELVERVIQSDDWQAELKDQLMTYYADMTEQQLAEVTQRAFILAELAGLESSAQDGAK